jgi:hypothetical protein
MARSPSSKGKIIVFGLMFWVPTAGITYQFLHYLIGLRRLGYDPYYVEDSARWVYHLDSGNRRPSRRPDEAVNVRAVAPILEEHGFSDHWAFRGYHRGGQCYGLSERQLLELYREADAFLNVTGAQEIRAEHMACPRRIYVESDPFASQVRVVNGDAWLIGQLAAHDMHFSFGENLGAPDCDVPLERFRWLPTRQPVDLGLWTNETGSDQSVYTTVTGWHSKEKNITYRGETYYWTKDREFKRFIDLPSRREVPFELAVWLGEKDRQLLRSHGWRHMDALDLSRDIYQYRTYIQRSRAEFTVARDQYVRPRTGWFSDRSACYLAAGRPVITQDTGFAKCLPNGKGLFAFQTLEDILVAVDKIESDYAGNCRAAREIAAEYFATEKVLTSLMAQAGL